MRQHQSRGRRGVARAAFAMLLLAPAAGAQSPTPPVVTVSEPV